MDKLKNFFTSENHSSSQVPDFTQEEEEEIRYILQIPVTPETKKPLKTLIYETIKNVQHETPKKSIIPISISSVEKENSVQTTTNSSESSNNDSSQYVINEENEELRDYDCSTFQVRSSQSKQEYEYGTFQVRLSLDSSSEDIQESSPIRPSSQDSSLWRKPEDWELKILALERGEWIDEMEDDTAFRRYKKGRPKLRMSVYDLEGDSGKLRERVATSLGVEFNRNSESVFLGETTRIRKGRSFNPEGVLNENNERNSDAKGKKEKRLASRKMNTSECLCVNITSAYPKQENGKVFTKYEIEVVHNNETIVVGRRYSEFRTLSEYLYEHKKDLSLPPFPPKKLFDNLSSVVIEERKKILNRWLQGVCRHPELVYDPKLLTFLTIYPSDIN